MELDDTDEAEKSGKEGSFRELRVDGVLGSRASRSPRGRCLGDPRTDALGDVDNLRSRSPIMGFG
jgi:hypothetical protein